MAPGPHPLFSGAAVIWSGKLIAGALGNLIGGPLAGLLAAGVGHTLDREVEGFRRAFHRQRSTEWRQHWYDVVFAAEFSLAGYLFSGERARADEADLCFDNLVERRTLNLSERERAWMLFRDGQRPDFPLTGFINHVRSETHRQREQVFQLLSTLLVYTRFERDPSSAQKRALSDIAARFAITDEILASLANASSKYRYESPASPSGALDQATAYSVLGVSSGATEAEVRRAYRAQMSRHHPDKLMHTHPSDDRLSQAARRTDLTRKAFDSIKRARGW